MSGMTSKHYLGVALAFGPISCFVIWVVYLIPLMPRTHAGKWPLYLLFFVLPLPQVFRVCRYIRKGMQPEAKAMSKGYHVFSGLPWAIISAYLLIVGLHHRRETFVFPLLYAVTAICLIFSVQSFYLAAKAPRGQPTLVKPS
jgi:hypothetical protein